jgi:hypothetical protein
MNKLLQLIVAILLISQTSFYSQNEAVKEAFLYLNKVRANPSSYSKEVGVPKSKS